MGAALALAGDVEEKEETIVIDGFEFTRSDIEGKDFRDKHSDKIAEKLAKNIYYTAFYPENRVRDLDETGEIAEDLVLSWQMNGDPQGAIEKLEAWAQDFDYTEDYDIRPAVNGFIEDLEEACEDEEWQIGFDLDDLSQELVERISEIVQDEDDSQPTDLLSSCDRAEMFLALCDPDPKLYFSDQNIETDRYSSWGDIEITRHWIDTLARLGYTLGEYRKHSGNRNESRDKGYRSSKKRRHPIVTLDELKELVENSCSSYFHIGIYGQFPLVELLNLDPNQPIIIKGYSVAVMGIHNGTFYDIGKKDSVIAIDRNDGKWVAFPKNGPSNWCGLCGSYYRNNISN